MADIPNPTPVIVPAKAEKVYDKQFCTRLEIIAHPERDWSAKIVGAPFDGTEIAPTGIIQIDLQDLKALSAKDPALAAAMGAVLNVIGTYLVKCRLKNKRVVTVDNIEEILE